MVGNYRVITLCGSTRFRNEFLYVINVGGYIGSGTRNEIEYSERTGKRVRYLEEI